MVSPANHLPRVANGAGFFTSLAYKIGYSWHVRFVPKEDILHSFDHLVGELLKM